MAKKRIRKAGGFSHAILPRKGIMRSVLMVFFCVLPGLFPLSGCTHNNEGQIFRADLSGEVETVDPQFATGADAQMVIYNIFEGLLVQDNNGEILPGAAASYALSADGLTYTFQLRQGLFWGGDEEIPLTAHDFVFAFRRLFMPSAPSPYASDYSMIKNARVVLQGQQPVSSLGVMAADDNTVVFRLEYQSDFFLELLTASAAMPCNEAFFDETRGRYGLDRGYVLSNGPFGITLWDNSMFQLRKNERYVSDLPVTAQGVNLYMGRTNLMEEFDNGRADLVEVSHEQLEEMEKKRASITPCDKTVWCIVFNLDSEIWGEALLRQGLAYTLPRDLISEELPDHLTPTAVFVPPTLQLVERSYRDLAGSRSPLGVDPVEGRRLYDLGVRYLELNSQPAAALIVPDSGSHYWNMSLAQQNWQRYLNAYFSLEEVTTEELEERFQSRDFEMMLMSFTPSTPGVDSLLGKFSSHSGQNYCGYHNPRFDAALSGAQSDTTVVGAAQDYWQAEAMLLGDAVVIPVYYETSYYALSKGVSGIQISPFAGRIYFKYASK